MSAFSQEVSAARLPDVVVQLRPDAFDSTWPHKPTGQVAVGLLLLSERNVGTCRAEASKHAFELHPEGERDPAWVEAYNDELMAWVMSRSLCNPRDAHEPFFAAQGQDEDTIKTALTSDGIRHLWDELERATIAKSPIRREATDEELRDLGEVLLLTGSLSTVQQKRMRKLASFTAHRH